MRVFVVALTLCSAVVVAYGQRVPMRAPELIDFRAQDHFTEEYQQAVGTLDEAVRYFESAPIQSYRSKLTDTLNQRQLLDAVRGILGLVNNLKPLVEYRHRQDDLRELLRSSARKLEDVVVRSAYFTDYPIEVSVDQARRFYRIKWDGWTGKDWTGPEITRRVPFVPTMRLTVYGTYAPDKGYGYRLENSPASKGSSREFWLECVGLTSERLELLRSQQKSEFKSVLPKGKVTVSIPRGGYLQDFIFRFYDKNNMTVAARPGESITYPPILVVPWRQLPGVVSCWADADDYQHNLSGETDPEIASQVFQAHRIMPTLETGPKKVPVYMYSGKTIGPVPAPGPSVTRSAFLQTILGYLSIAAELGWIQKTEVSTQIASSLRMLAKQGFQRPQTAKIIAEIERGYRNRDFHEETFVLLKYNLLYLSDMYN